MRQELTSPPPPAFFIYLQRSRVGQYYEKALVTKRTAHVVSDNAGGPVSTPAELLASHCGGPEVFCVVRRRIIFALENILLVDLYSSKFARAYTSILFWNQLKYIISNCTHACSGIKYLLSVVWYRFRIFSCRIVHTHASLASRAGRRNSETSG